MTFPTNNKQSKDNKSSDPYDSSKHDTNSNSATIIFQVTENMSKIGLKEFVFNRKLFQFRFGSRNLCIVPFAHNKTTLKKLCKLIKDKLSKKLEYSEYPVDNPQTFEAALYDIENQVIEKKDEIFLNSTNQEQDDKNDPDKEYKIEFQKEVSIIRNHFREASDPYKEWQLKVQEKYQNLEKIFKKHYPEAWIFMEFCLSVKSILNIVDFTLPFMGVILAPPSSMKTMVIQLFRKYPDVFYTDGFTSSSLVSHNAALNEEQLQKVDMLPKMKSKLVLTPELALFFTGKEEDLQKVMGIITRVLDGHGLENDSGAHGHRKYGDTMFVWLGAAVEIPFRVWKLLGTLGHKIYFIRPNFQKKTISDLKRIAKNNNFSSINKEIELALLDYLKTFDAAPEIDEKVKIESDIVKIKWNEEKEGEQDKALEYIAQLANLLAPLRGDVYVSQSKVVNRKINHTSTDNTFVPDHNYQDRQPHQVEGQDYDTDFPIIEDASRAVVLLRNLAIGHAISQGRDSLSIKDVPIAIKVALSTAPVRRVRILDLLLKSANGVLTTSQICNELSISQPVVTRTMREFDALGIANISAVGGYDNSELQIKLNQEFEWFGTDEFLKLKEDFVPYEKKNNGNDDFDKQSVDDSSFTEDDNENHVVKNDNTDNPTSQNKDLSSSLESKEQHNINSDTVETVETCDNNKACHTFIDNLPLETQQKNDVFDNGTNQSESSKEDYDLQSSLIQNQNENCEHQLSSSSNHSDDHDIEKNSVSLWGLKSLEHVTLSHEIKEEDRSPFQIPSDIKESDGVKYTAFEEILRTIKERQGSCIALNYSIEIASKNNDAVRSYLNGKLTSRENRNVRDIVSNIVNHPNIEVVKQKPQILVKWSEQNEDSSTNAKEDQIV